MESLPVYNTTFALKHYKYDTLKPYNDNDDYIEYDSKNDMNVFYSKCKILIVMIFIVSVILFGLSLLLIGFIDNCNNISSNDMCNNGCSINGDNNCGIDYYLFWMIILVMILVVLCCVIILFQVCCFDSCVLSNNSSVW